MNRKQKKTLLRQTILVFLLLAGYLALDRTFTMLERRKAELIRQQASDLEILRLEEDQILEIGLEGEGRSLRFLKEGETWTCPEDSFFVMNEEKLRRILQDLNPLSAVRKLEGENDPASYGLTASSDTVTVTDQSGKKVRLQIGNRNEVAGGLYIRNEETDTVYLTAVPLDRDTAGDLKAFAVYESAPEWDPSRIRKIEVQKEENPFILVTPGDDTCTVEGEDQVPQPADLSAVGLVQNRLGNLSWLSDLEYHCTDLAAYGLDNPHAVITVTSEDGSETCLILSQKNADGNYYVMLEGSEQVHSVRGEYLEALAEGKPQDFWSLTYSFVSIGDLESMEAEYQGETHTLRRVSDDGSQSDEHLTWFVDGKQVEKEPFTRFYYSCVSMTAAQRLDTVPDPEDSPVLKLHYNLTDGREKEMSYYSADQDFCLVIYEEGTKAAYVNRLSVKTMTDNLEALLGTI